MKRLLLVLLATCSLAMTSTHDLVWYQRHISGCGIHWWCFEYIQAEAGQNGCVLFNLEPSEGEEYPGPFHCNTGGPSESTVVILD